MHLDSGFKSTIRGDHHRFKDHKNEARVFKRRVIFAGLFLLSLICILAIRFYDLQVSNHQNYATQSDRNRLQVRPVPPNRGLFFDAKGTIVAENRAISILTITRELVDDIDETLDELDQIIGLTTREKSNFYKSLKWRRRPYQPVPLKYNLNEEDVAKIAVNEYRLNGVDVQGRLVRHYPYSDLFTHAIGYVGRISELELSNFSPEEVINYAGTDSVGKIGLEKFYESLLVGTVGQERIETNARGRVLRVVENEKNRPSSGGNIQLFLDVDIQKAAVAALDGRRGAVVAIDVESGGILALVSSPSYDPNLFVTGISEKNYKKLNESRDLPLFNRAIQGQYPPGSTIKPMLGLGGLEYKIISATTKIPDPGFYQLENDERLYRDWKPEGHGALVDVRTAITESCDVFFYDLGKRLGVDKMHAFGKHFGLGEKSNIDVPSERAGLWPSRDWKKRTRGLNWYPGNSLNMSIGQGDVLVTPLQLAQMQATFARRGEYIEPRVAKRIDGKLTVKQVRSIYQGEARHWDLVLSSMRDVVHSYKGTAHAISRGMSFTMAGKTGTAQVVSIAQDEEYDSEALSERNRDHALFVGHAPFESPEIAVAVVIENGEKSSAAGIVSRKVMEAYLNQKTQVGQLESGQ